MVEGRIKKIKKARFALPSLVTLGSVFCAFLSMSFVFKSQALQGDERLLLLQYAAIAIIGSIVFDTFDGKVARWTKTSTKFGMELDSLSDCVSFGIAPALLIYGFALNEAGIFGLIASFIYACGAILRLARFNIEAPEEGVQTFFKGIPSPAGAACLAAIVLACIDTQLMPSTPFELNTLCVVAIAVGLLMVSNVKYKTLKGKKTKGDIAFVLIGLILFGSMCFVLTPSIAFFLLVCYFVVYGMLLTIYLNLQRVPRRRRAGRESSISNPAVKRSNKEETTKNADKDADNLAHKDNSASDSKSVDKDADNSDREDKSASNSEDSKTAETAETKTAETKTED